MNHLKNKKSPLSKMRSDNGQRGKYPTYLDYNTERMESQEVILNDLQK